LGGAIKALDDTIAKRISCGQNSDQDFSDLLYNKACYVNELVKKQATENLREQLRVEAWNLLKESVKIWPPNLEDAKKDEDFELLTNDVRTWDTLRG
jgi:hypothetical protein